MTGLGEADTRAKLIDPAIHKRGWTEELIRREETAGTVEIHNGKPRRRSRGYVDYTLRIKINPDTQPVAVALIEAKKEDLPPTHGLEQGKAYAKCKRLNVPFVISSNGHLFVEYDVFTGLTSEPRPLTEFPTPAELRQRYEQGKGFSLESPAAKPLLTPYTGGEATRRYYQDAAIRAVLEKIAKCAVTDESPRALLSLATGAGKTFIAVNLLKRIADAGQLKRALFVCDRDELRTQGLRAFQNAFGSDAAPVFQESDGRNHARNARVHIATYQTLGVDSDDSDPSFLLRHYPENYFSHIVIDECHRSAWGKWSQVLTRNADAVQVGLTATPREIKVSEKVAGTAEAAADEQITADNLKYFGEPVYEYEMAQAIEDGYLAACRIPKMSIDIDNTGITIEQIIARNPVDAITGQPVSEEQIRELYEKTSYEKRVILPDRRIAMCQDLFNRLLKTGGPCQKTIIFCATDRHADEVAIEMNNLYARHCSGNGDERLENYAFKCTASVNGNDQLPDFRGGSRSHFIATTVDLLTTGVDVPCVRNIAFFKYVRSPIAFYQMVGRGTRIDPASKKLMFSVFDYTDATSLFGQAFVTGPTGPDPEPGPGPGPGPGPEPDPIIRVDGFDVMISDAGTCILTSQDGRAMPIPEEEYKAQLAARLMIEAPTLDEFRTRWVQPQERHDMIDAIVQAGYSPTVVQRLEELDDCDLYDVLAHLGYGLAPRTRTDRTLAFTYKHEDWLTALPADTMATIRAIAAQFESGGTDGLESPHIFDTPSVVQAGGLAALKAAGNPADLLRETKERMFAA